jgi:hypothetical protein
MKKRAKGVSADRPAADANILMVMFTPARWSTAGQA